MTTTRPPTPKPRRCWLQSQLQTLHLYGTEVSLARRASGGCVQRSDWPWPRATWWSLCYRGESNIAYEQVDESARCDASARRVFSG